MRNSRRGPSRLLLRSGGGTPRQTGNCSDLSSRLGYPKKSSTTLGRTRRLRRKRVLAGARRGQCLWIAEKRTNDGISEDNPIDDVRMMESNGGSKLFGEPGKTRCPVQHPPVSSITSWRKEESESPRGIAVGQSPNDCGTRRPPLDGLSVEQLGRWIQNRVTHLVDNRRRGFREKENAGRATVGVEKMQQPGASLGNRLGYYRRRSNPLRRQG